MPREALGVLLMSGGHERAQYGLMVAVSAAALGRAAVVFATNEGCRALGADPSGIVDWARDARVQAAGVAGVEELREAAVGLGVRLMACEAGLRMAGMGAEGLMPGVEVAGLATFLGAVGGGQIVTL